MIKRNLIIILFVAIIITIGVYFYQPPVNDGKIMITIDGKIYDDELFKNYFDYSTLKGKKIELNIQIKSEEFAIRDEVIDSNYTTLNEVWNILSELKTPNIVVGFSKYLNNGSYCEAVTRYYGSDTNCSEKDEVGRNFGVLGSVQYSDVIFNVYRRNLSGKDYLYVSKMYLRAGSRSSIWSMFVGLDEPNVYRVELKKYALK